MDTIHFAVGPTSLGLVLIARSDLGITAVLIDDDREALTLDLRRRFPAASLIDESATPDPLALRVLQAIDASDAGLDVPLDLRGSAFQRTVWQALREIAPGSTMTYTDVARRIGRPQAVRAVAQACATNPVAIFVPCHRVVRTDGQLAGYRWGIARKRALLAREALASTSP